MPKAMNEANTATAPRHGSDRAPAGRGPRGRRRLDPVRVHGAWVYLCVGIAAGALLESGHGVEPAMLVGTGFAGGFLLAGALFVGWRRRQRQLAVGAGLAVLMPLAAWLLTGSASMFWPIFAAGLLSIGGLAAARRYGFLAMPSVVLGTATLAAAAPSAALAGGADVPQAAALFGLLWPFYCWRTLRVAADMGTSHQPDRRRDLRQRGLREAAGTAIWAIASVILVHWLIP